MRVLHVESIGYRFRSSVVLSDCSFRISKGEIVLLLGANGAGKSTLLRILARLARPRAGQVVMGPSGDASIGFGAHDLMLYGELSVEENLRLFCSLQRRGSQSEVQLALDRSLTDWALTPFRSTPLNQLSKGSKAKVALARVFLAQSSVLLLDEPSSSLDDGSAELLCSMVQKQGESSCLIATHDLARLRRIATRILVLAERRVKFDSADLVADLGPEGALIKTIERYQGINR